MLGDDSPLPQSITRTLPIWVHPLREPRLGRFFRWQIVNHGCQDPTLTTKNISSRQPIPYQRLTRFPQRENSWHGSYVQSAKLKVVKLKTKAARLGVLPRKL